MSAQSGAWSAAVDTAGERHSIFNSAIRAAFLAASIAAAGCTPATTRVAGADPADPAARTKAVGYHSAIAPYTALRPSAPAPWRERNERVAPRTGRE